MKAVFISFNQAHREDVEDIMLRLDVKGYTGWESLIGAGSKSGEPHLGSHAWPTLNTAFIAIVDDDTVDSFLSELKQLDTDNPQLGLRAFSWNVEKTI